jgi:ribosomal protein S5
MVDIAHDVCAVACLPLGWRVVVIVTDETGDFIGVAADDETPRAIRDAMIQAAATGQDPIEHQTERSIS